MARKTGDAVISTLVIIFFSSIIGLSLEYGVGFLTSFFGNVVIADLVIALIIALIIDHIAISSVRSRDFKTFGAIYLVVFIVMLLGSWGIVHFMGLEEILP